MTSLKSLELQRQKEIIEQWLNTPGLPVDARAKLFEMLSEVKEEMNSLVTSGKRLDDVRHRPAR